MAEQFNADWARGIIDGGMDKAKEFLGDESKMDDLLGQVGEKLQGLPKSAVDAFSNVPLMARMVKSYVTGEYKDVSVKVVVALVSAFLYLVKQRDLIPDYIPVLGFADDLAVVAVALAISKPELEAFDAWRSSSSTLRDELSRELGLSEAPEAL